MLIAVTTGMRMSEIFGLTRSNVVYNEGLLAVRAKLKGGKMRYVPMPPELAALVEDGADEMVERRLIRRRRQSQRPARLTS